jgi:hypothetical protein
VTTQGACCQEHRNRARFWGPRIVKALTRYLTTHPDDYGAKIFRDELDAALQKPEARGARGMVERFRKDENYEPLRKAAFPGMPKKDPGMPKDEYVFRRTPADRFNKGVAQIYAAERATTAAGQKSPTLAYLIKHKLPKELRNRWGFVVFCAALQQLHKGGRSHVEIAKHFGLSVDENVRSGRSWLVSHLLRVADRLERMAARKRGFYQRWWTRAKAEATRWTVQPV